MTRANLNFIGHQAILFHYHNGDQNPEGLVDYFGVAELCRIDRLWVPDDFQNWIRKNYTESARRITTHANGMSVDAHVQTDTPAEPQVVEQPCIFYTGSFLTDYSYVFTHSFQRSRRRQDGSHVLKDINYIYVFNWSKLLFKGTPKRFLVWVEKRRQSQAPHILPPDQSAKASVERTLLQQIAPQADA